MPKQTTGKKKHRILRWSVVILIVLLLGITIGGGEYLISYAIGRSGGGGNRQVSLAVDNEAVSKTEAARQENQVAQSALTQAFTENVAEEAVRRTTADGLTLNAGYYANAGSHQWAIVIHGYRGNHLKMLNYIQRYYDAGYQVLAPDLRGCGDSEGNYVTMGWLDRLDMVDWIQWILQQDSEAEIVLHGVSMGAATVMMTSGEALPEDANIIFVEDCGYTSVWDIFSSELALRFHIPTFPILNCSSLLTKLQAGYSFTEASALNQVAKCERPMLFIHGDQDNFVPFSMMQVLYDAKPGDNKQMLAVEGVGHGAASSVLGDAYWDTVFAFIETYRQ